MLSYIQSKLIDTGYDDCVPAFELNGTPSDGVAWYGLLNSNSLACRLMEGPDRRAATKALSKGTALKIVRDGELKHFGLLKTMVVEIVYPRVHISEIEDRAIKLLKHYIEIDFVARSVELEAHCKSLYESNIQQPRIVQRYRRGKYEIIVSEIPDMDNFDDFPLMKPGTVEKIITGQLQRHGMMASVCDGNTTVGQTSLFGFLKRAGSAFLGKGHRGYVQRMKRQVIAEAGIFPDGS